MYKNNDDVLNIVYKINESLTYDVDNKGVVTILEKQNHKVQNFFRKLKFKIPEYKKIAFDEYASFVFLQIDVIKTVKEIGEALELKFGDKAHPVYERLLLFLNHIEVNSRYITKTEN